MAKTSIIGLVDGKVYFRGNLPSDDTDGKPARNAPHYQPAHTKTYTPGTIDLKTGVMKLQKQREEWRPASIQVGNFIFEVVPLSGGKIKPHMKGRYVKRTARVILPEDMAHVHALDEQIRKLQDTRDEVMIEAAARGRLVTTDDCGNYKDA